MDFCLRFCSFFNYGAMNDNCRMVRYKVIFMNPNIKNISCFFEQYILFIHYNLTRVVFLGLNSRTVNEALKKTQNSHERIA